MMGDEFESEIGEDEIYASITPRKFDRQTMLALWLQYRAHKKLVKGDFYTSVAAAALLHREYKISRSQFQEQASREMEALIEGVSRGSAD
jgi:hypothetical protein